MTNKKKKREDLLENKIYRTIIDILEILNRPLTFEQLKICLTNNQSKYSKDWKHENQAILNQLKKEGVNIQCFEIKKRQSLTGYLKRLEKENWIRREKPKKRNFYRILTDEENTEIMKSQDYNYLTVTRGTIIRLRLKMRALYDEIKDLEAVLKNHGITGEQLRREEYTQRCGRLKNIFEEMRQTYHEYPLTDAMVNFFESRNLVPWEVYKSDVLTKIAELEKEKKTAKTIEYTKKLEKDIKDERMKIE